MKRILLSLTAFIIPLAFSSSSFAQPAAEIARTELEFAKDAKERSFIYGFNKFAAPNAIWFNPEMRKVQEDLREMRKIPSFLEGAKLRWWPHHIGVAKSGDFGFDLGPWFIDGTPKSGFYFTIWSNIAPGIWAYALDTGAGNIANRNTLPKPDSLKAFNKIGKSKPKSEYQALENNVNLALKQTEAQNALQSYLFSDSLIAIEEKEFAIDSSLNAVNLAQMPKGNWKNNGFLFANSGDMASSFGEVTNDKGEIIGEYIRLWFCENTIGAKPKIYIQLYRPRPDPKK